MRARGVFALLLAGCGDGATASPDMAAPCDPIRQDCAGAAKCTLVFNDGGTGLVTACVGGGGAAAAGDHCTRTSDGGDPGMDDCARGLFCSSLGEFVAQTSGRCRTFCRGDGDCGGARCAAMDATPPFGVCVPQCTAFGADCANGLSCANFILGIGGASVSLGCRSVGAIALGQPCGHDLDCGADLVCVDPTFMGQRTCTPLCDAGHPCAGGSCAQVPGLPAGTGVCR